ncbi:ABC-type transporter, integral membrane subunit [Oleidesulfovibrio alaskensis G20]|uniref:ABC-type transporter, integral membrane subunit n=1 Tax=Oleidesulfovibrio alaskensis (strain ATCC BAA-1058 / DSM 17464 / G20) TaxID=207559 RepID=Q315I5_OLEA2|nr:ABC-type transporter, integral membrane subunit [Oleidesulfovibrio alaskensis G20]
MDKIKQSLLICFWFMFMTFPLVVIRVDTINDTVTWRWLNMVYIGAGSFVLSFVWRWAMARRNSKRASGSPAASPATGMVHRLGQDRRFSAAFYCAVLGLGIVLPWLVSTYQTNIMISFLLYVILGLGLNIVVGVAGMLFLGYAAFYAIGAYSYALLNTYFGLGFWTVLPVGGILAAAAGVALAFPVLRLRGDYLAIVTLGFGEIVRLVLENWSDFTQGPSGISNIPRPSLFGAELGVAETGIYIYYIVLVMAVLTVAAVQRIKDSRIGRALQALREDEIACQAMGIDRVNVKLTAFGVGTAWAGFAGVIFAAKTTFINPASFTFMESAIILSIVVLGGMGSRRGFSHPAARIPARICRIPHAHVRIGHGTDDGLPSAGADHAQKTQVRN